MVTPRYGDGRHTRPEVDGVERGHLARVVAQIICAVIAEPPIASIPPALEGAVSPEYTCVSGTAANPAGVGREGKPNGVGEGGKDPGIRGRVFHAFDCLAAIDGLAARVDGPSDQGLPSLSAPPPPLPPALVPAPRFYEGLINVMIV